MTSKSKVVLNVLCVKVHGCIVSCTLTFIKRIFHYAMQCTSMC